MCLVAFGGRGCGKSTFLFETSFFELISEQIRDVDNAWFQAYEICIDQRARVEKQTNLLSVNGITGKSLLKHSLLIHFVADKE